MSTAQTVGTWSAPDHKRGWGAALKGFIHRAQVGRMRSILHRLSDHELAMIDVKREDIDAHVGKIMDLG